MLRDRRRRSPITSARVCGCLALSALLAHVAGCVGNIGGSDGILGSGPGGGGDGGPGDDGSVIAPRDPNLVAAAAHARRLSVTEIKNSMRDVFGIDDADFPAASFPVEGLPGRFDNQWASLPMSDAFVDSLQTAAEWAGAKASARLAALLPCAAAPTDENACAGEFVDTFAPRVYRRPVTPAERAMLLGVYTTTRKAEDFPTSLATVIEAMLQSPSFVFRTELGAASAKVSGLTPHEIASELSYFLWQSTPDATLLDAAKAGKLASQTDIAAQAARMLQDPRATAAAHAMFVQWLGIGGIEQISKLDPAWTPALAASMQGEVGLFLDQEVWGAGGFAKLFASPRTFIDKNLAAIYGVPPPSGAGLVPASLDPATHAGILTMPGFVAIHSPGEFRSPVMLGKFVRGSLLCQGLPPPPPGIPPVPTDPNLDEKSRYYQHDHDATCQGCHSLMDPLGYGWSQYDVLGRFSPADHGVTEDGAGNVTGTDVDGAFAGPVALGAKLAASRQVQDCFAATVIAWALGRQADASVAGSSDAHALALGRASGFATGDMRALFAAIVASDAFLFRDTSAVPQGASKP